MKKISIIGSGFSSLSSACYLAKQGYQVDVFEKNSEFGGRARRFSRDGFHFDMGPSWYWMPDVFDRFFADFGKKTSDYYSLSKLSPAYKVFYKDSTSLEIPSTIEETYKLFEKEEKGSSKQLRKLLKEAKYNYDVAIKKLVYKPGLSPTELFTPQTIKNINQFISTIHTDVNRRFTSEKLVKLLEFPVLFLGAKPHNTPSFYNFMNYADLELGTWYPKGGMYEIVKAMLNLGKELGVKYHSNAPIDKILVSHKKVKGIVVNKEIIYSDFVLSGADYNHTEALLDPEWRSYSKSYWNKKTFAPSALLFFVGLNKKLKNIRHHNLFFDKDFDLHAKEIYDIPRWPSDPLFYANFPSINDSSLVPEGKESGFFLIPLAPDLEDSPETHDRYFDMIINRFEKLTGQLIKKDILFRHSYSVDDFKKDYNSYKGNAYGMANTLSQTAFLRPKIRSKKLENLYFTGQLTVPGPGVPPALISGKIAAEQIIKNTINIRSYDTVI